MRILVQRVQSASVTVEGRVVAAIGPGLLALVGFTGTDEGRVDLQRAARKLVDLRIFSDEAGKMNRSVRDVGGEILLVSQFTLYADTSRGNRPGFEQALAASKAQEYYRRFVEAVQTLVPNTQTGIFQAHMSVALTNDGPVTVLLEF